MSTLPGLSLESYVMWDLDLIVDGDTTANPSLMLAELLGTSNYRKRLTGEQFKPILQLYEPYRVDIESRLLSFDEDGEEAGSWRDYAGSAFAFIPDTVRQQARHILGVYS